MDRHNQATVDAQRQPAMPTTPALVLHAVAIPDYGMGFLHNRLRVAIDGTDIPFVPYGWSVHPLDVGPHTLKASVRLQIFAGARAAKFVLTEQSPVVLVHGSFFGGMVTRWRVEPYPPVS
jgi:hypothetical protein